MRHTNEEIERAAARFDELADALEEAGIEADDMTDLRAVAATADDVRADEARLHEAVDAARARGRSWNRIALALGVSRQAARQRFSKPGAVNH